MSTQALNYYLNTFDMTGSAPAILYDFTSYYEPASLVYSVESGNPVYSGEVSASFASFTGNSSGSGFFTDQHIEVVGDGNLQSPTATFLFSQQKSGREEGTIFSNLSGLSGYEIGINQANKLYFNHYVDGIPSIKTFNNTPAEKNIYGVQVGEGRVNMYRVNPSSPDLDNPNFESQSFSIPSYAITNGVRWKVGSGTSQYKGWMDYFAYFPSIISQEKLQTFATSLYKSYELSGEVTGYGRSLVTGVTYTTGTRTGIVGYINEVTGQYTGITGFSYSSGVPVTGAVPLSGTIYVPVTGIMDAAYSGDNYGWMHDIVYQKIENVIYSLGTGGLEASARTGFSSSGNHWFGDWLYKGRSGTYEGKTGIGAANTLFGITGFDYSTYTVQVTGASGNLLGQKAITGIDYRTYDVSVVTGAPLMYIGTGAREIVKGSLPSGYFYDYLSNLKNEGITGLFERIMTDEIGSINNQGILKQSVSPTGFYMGLTGRSTISGNILVNGISLLSGSSITTRNDFNEPRVRSTNDFFVSGLTKIYTTEPLQMADELYYDYNQTGLRNGILKITSTSDYETSLSLPVDNKQIFFNGVKIYSGINWLSDGSFIPTGTITGATGTYFAYANYAGATQVTGESSSILEVKNEYFKDNAYVMYINGVRQSIDNFIAHAGQVDFITGKIVIDETPVNLYNKYITYKVY